MPSIILPFIRFYDIHRQWKPRYVRMRREPFTLMSIGGRLRNSEMLVCHVVCVLSRIQSKHNGKTDVVCFIFPLFRSRSLTAIFVRLLLLLYYNDRPLIISFPMLSVPSTPLLIISVAVDWTLYPFSLPTANAVVCIDSCRMAISLEYNLNW